jgi:hypothetical protein
MVNEIPERCGQEPIQVFTWSVHYFVRFYLKLHFFNKRYLNFSELHENLFRSSRFLICEDGSRSSVKLENAQTFVNKYPEHFTFQITSVIFENRNKIAVALLEERECAC